MTEPLEHDRYSELLGAYARAELDPPEQEAVEAHLETCSDCRAELAGIRSLLAVEAPSLGERERRRLRAAVGRALEDGSQHETYPVRRSWAHRFAPTLGAAALLLVAVVVALSGGPVGDEAALDSGAEFQAPAGREEGRRAGGGGDQADEAQDDSDREEGFAPNSSKPGTKELTTETAGRAAAPKPVFRDELVDGLGDLSESRLLARFAATYTAADANKRWRPYLQLLSEDAPASARDQVRECGSAVDQTSNDSVLPALGAYGRIEDEPSLVLSFVYGEEASGPLESYMVWAWPRGSCTTRLDYASGPIDD